MARTAQRYVAVRLHVLRRTFNIMRNASKHQRTVNRVCGAERSTSATAATSIDSGNGRSISGSRVPDDAYFGRV